MIFDEEFLESLPEDAHNAIWAICDKFMEKWRADIITLDLVLESFALISIYSEANNLQIVLPDVDDSKGSMSAAYDFINKLQKKIKPKAISKQFKEYKNLFATKLGTAFYYEFPEGDLKRIQQLISELRDLISESQEIEEDHKSRLLKKLEKVQSELHKKVSDLDRWWGFFLDASIVLGQAGENVKPMIDRIRELVSIIWPVQTRVYDLPSSLPFKLLGQAKNDKSKDDRS